MDLSSSPTSSSDEGSVTMGRQHSLSRPSPKRGELDLSALLNVEQKDQLKQLINEILDSMQKKVRDVFDNLKAAPPEPCQGIIVPKATWNLIPNPRSAKYAALYGLEPLSKPKEGDSESQKENAKPAAEPTPIPAALTALAAKGPLQIPKSVQEASEMMKKDENDILAASLNELKRDALTYFGKWRGAVLRRVGDINIKNGGNGGNVTPQPPPGSSRRPGGASRGRTTRPSGGVVVSVQESNSVLEKTYPAQPTPLASLPKEKRALILHSMLLMLLGLENYATYSRILLLYLASSMQIPGHVLVEDERRVARGLSEIVKGISTEEIAQKRAEEGKSTRRNKAALASTSIAPICTTGGLPEGLATAGIGTVFGGLGVGSKATAGLLGTMAESTVVVGTLFGLYGARATGKMVDSYAKDIQDFAFLPLHGSLKGEYLDPKDVPAEDRRLRVVLGISGWLTRNEDVVSPFRVLGDRTELYALRWELEALTKMGNALEIVTNSMAWTCAKKEIKSRTVFDSLRDGHWPIGLLKISKVIDNPWCVGMVRAEKAGVVLADAIINKVQGERGITLVGFSLGARVIYNCLMHLQEKRHFGYVENVVMMGGPCPTEVRTWASMRSVVTGRLVNVYSKDDYILGFLSRSSTYLYGVAGLQKIEGVDGVENEDVSDIVVGHFRYQHLVSSILKKIGWEDLDQAQVLRDQEALKRHMVAESNLDREREEQEIRQVMAKVDLDKEAEKVEAEVEKKNQQSSKGRKKKAGGVAKQSG